MSVEAQERVFALLRELNIPYQVVDHPAVYTIEDMVNLKLEHIDKVAKNLFVRDDKKRNYYLVVIQQDKSANALVRNVLDYTNDMEHVIVLMHDFYTRETSLEALPRIIAGLREQGYTFDIVRNYGRNFP